MTFSPLIERLSVRSIAVLALGFILADSSADAQLNPQFETRSSYGATTEKRDKASDFSQWFKIAAQPLPEALAEFARQAQVRVRVAASTINGARSSAVEGNFTAEQALERLLVGTGLSARFVDSHTAVVSTSVTPDSTARALAPVMIIAASSSYSPLGITTALKTATPLRQTPQSITVVSRDLIADQAMLSMADVARYIPGVTMGQGEGHRDAPTIRGNSSTADFFVDGVRDDVQYFRDLYNVERVEGLKGGNAMIFGRGGGGGVINRVTKDANWSPVRRFTLQGGSHDQKRMSMDLGQGLTRNVAARLNGMYENSGVFRDAVDVERYGINPTMTFATGAGTALHLGYELFDDHRTVDRGIPSFQGRPSPAGITTFFGDPNASHARARIHAAGATVEHTAGSGVKIQNRTRFADHDKFYQNVFPGAVSTDGSQVALRAYNNATQRRNLFNQTDLTYGLWTSAVRHTLLVGAEVGRQESDNFRQTGYFNDTSTAATAAFDNPTVAIPVTFRQSATDADNRVIANAAALYAQDQLTLSSQWRAVFGVRYERFDLRYHDNRSGEDFRRDDHMISPRAGLLFDPADALSLYGAYSVSFLPSSGDQFSSLTPTTETLEPERFSNYEVGAKWDVSPALALTTALYRLDRTNTSARDPDVPDLIVQTGSQRTTGVELGASGRLTNAWQIAGGYASQRARITSTTTAALAGAEVPLVPRHTLSLWNKYQLTRAWGVGLGVIHQTDMYASISNTVTLPGFTRVDGALYFNFSRQLSAQLNVENLFDARYYVTSHGNDNILPGASRSVRLSLSTGF